jgi:toxin ParE1/3/4
MARIIRRPQAIREVRSLWRYIALKSGTGRADAFVDKIDEKLKVLAAQPGIGRPRDELREGLRSLPVASYVIFYHPRPDGIEVVHVIHGHQDIDAIFEGEGEDDE